MKLSTLLGDILTTPSMRTGNDGVCDLIPPHLYEEFLEARAACSQTYSRAYPVAHPDRPGKHGAVDAFYKEEDHWRGQYGINRRSSWCAIAGAGPRSAGCE